MPNKFSRWLHQKKGNNDRKGPSSDSRMPILPAQRPHILSPSPSRESLIVSTAAATINSAFYQRLPAELRRQILIEAFGGRTIHMDLSFDHPMAFLTDQEARPLGDNMRHCGLKSADNSHIHSPLKRDVSRPKTWQWFGCVCHLDPEKSVRGNDLVSEPWTDDCLDGTAAWCRGWPGKVPQKCFLGVMGWLQSCRQAYVDGIEILYATNNIHMSSGIMIRHLSDLILPQRLASIISVQMVWRLNGVFRPTQAEDTPDSGKEAFEALLQAVPRSLPNLHNFYVGLLGPSYMPTNDPARRPVAEILVPIDSMVRALGPQLEEVDLALPSTIFRPYWDENIMKGHRFESRRWVSDRIWRTLAPTASNETMDNEEQGYWLRQGKDDIYYPPTPCF